MVRKARTEYSDRNNVVRLGARYNYRTEAPQLSSRQGPNIHCPFFFLHERLRGKRQQGRIGKEGFIKQPGTP